jgi:hypothetical protein
MKQSLMFFFDLMENIQEQVQQPEDHEGQQAEEIDLNVPASLGYVSTPDSVVSSPKLPDDLQAPPVNFLVEEVQQHELLSTNNSDENMVLDNGQSSSTGSVEAGNLHVGMALLPDNLDFDLSFLVSQSRVLCIKTKQ